MRWKRGEVIHRVDGKALAHPSHPRHEDISENDMKQILSSPYRFKNSQVENIDRLMEKIDRHAVDIGLVSPLRRHLRLPNLPKITNNTLTTMRKIG